MAYALDKALQEMTLEENRPIKLKNLPQFSSCERNGCNIMGRLLCPTNQKMSRFIHDMPRLWHINNRARGIALSDEKFQFIFDNEHDLETVLYSGAWTYEDSSMVLERWMEKPPEDYLKILPIWIRLRNIPVNYYTADTCEEIAENIGQVVEVAFDPLRPQSKGFVRVKILFDVNRPLWNSKEVDLPTGEKVTIGIEYERVRKRCFQCQRLTHDKPNCPFNPQNRQGFAMEGIKMARGITGANIPKISEDDPLYGVLTNDDVGIDLATGRAKIAKEVLDEMRAYLSLQDPTEKQARILRVRRQVWGLDGDTKGQKTLLRLEPATVVMTEINKGKGLVFDFDVGKSTKESPSGDKLMASAIAAGKNSAKSVAHRFITQRTMAMENHMNNSSTVSKTGVFNASSSETVANVKKYRRRPSQHKRKAQAAQASQVGRRVEVIYKEKTKPNGEEGTVLKRKAVEDVDTSPKQPKLNNLEVVPYEEPPKQL